MALYAYDVVLDSFFVDGMRVGCVVRAMCTVPPLLCTAGSSLRKMSFVPTNSSKTHVQGKGREGKARTERRKGGNAIAGLRGEICEEAKRIFVVVHVVHNLHAAACCVEICVGMY